MANIKTVLSLKGNIWAISSTSARYKVTEGLLGTSAKRNVYNVYKVTFPESLHADVHVTQMALAALDNVGRRGWHGTGGSAPFVVPQAALLLDGHPINHLQRGETLLPCAAAVTLAHAALTHTLLVSEDWSASRQFCIWWEETEIRGETH